jgi:ribosomal protein S18 acetylase RimI-like enzyme
MPDDAITIRAATNDDSGAVLRFWHSSAYGESPTDDDKALSVLRQSDGGAMLLAVDGNRIIGSIIAGWDGWRGNLYRLAVLDAYRQRGIGAMLVREAEKRLRALGARRIGAIVEVDNDRGRAFWEAQGYAVATAQMRFYKDVKDVG